MSVIDDLERRLENWASWHGGAGVGSAGCASIYDFGGRSPRDFESLPVINSEAIETENAVQKLDGALGAKLSWADRPMEAALRGRYLRLAKDGVTGELYLMRTLSEVQVAAALYISYRTYIRRLDQARHALLEQLWLARNTYRKIEA